MNLVIIRLEIYHIRRDSFQCYEWNQGHFNSKVLAYRSIVTTHIELATWIFMGLYIKLRKREHAWFLYS